MIIHNEETYSRTEMVTLQLARLQETLERVYNKVPFYQNKFKESNVIPENITSLEDLTETSLYH